MSIILNTKFAEIQSPYSKTQLEKDLANGVANVVAGVGSDYRLNVDTAGACITISHKDAVFKGTAIPGSVKPCIGITAAGIAMGYNRASDGAWVDGVAITADGTASFSGAINATSGNFTGTVKAGSIIASSVTVDGTTLSTIKAGASAGATAVQPAAITGMLKADTSYVLTGIVTPADSGAIKVGTIAWNSTTGAITGGTGVAITSHGIVGALNGVETFAITAAGNARFKGDISGSTGTFSGTISASNITGGMISAAVSLQTTGFILANPSTYLAQYNAAVWAEPQSYGMFGVAGIIHADNSQAGVLGYSYSYTGTGVYAVNTAGGYALYADGKVSLSGNVDILGETRLSKSLTLDHSTSTNPSTDTSSGGFSAHATHDLAATYYRAGAVPVATTAPYLYFWVGGKVVGYINGAGIYAVA